MALVDRMGSSGILKIAIFYRLDVFLESSGERTPRKSHIALVTIFTRDVIHDIAGLTVRGVVNVYPGRGGQRRL